MERMGCRCSGSSTALHRLDAAGKAVAHDQVVALTELQNKGVEAGVVVAIIGVAHDDVLAAGGEGCAVEGCSVAALLDVDDGGAPQSRAICCEPSEEPLSPMTTSPRIWERWR